MPLGCGRHHVAFGTRHRLRVCACPQVSAQDNKDGFVVTLNGAVLSGTAEERNSVTVPGPKGASTHLYISIACGYVPIRTPVVGQGQGQEWQKQRFRAAKPLLLPCRLA